jgi:hypothetical protein
MELETKVFAPLPTQHKTPANIIPRPTSIKERKSTFRKHNFNRYIHQEKVRSNLTYFFRNFRFFKLTIDRN